MPSTHPTTSAVAAAARKLKVPQAQLRAPAERPSLAATFPNPRRHRTRNQQRRGEPLRNRMSHAARYLARRGAMEPEGCTAGDLQRTLSTRGLEVNHVKEILRTLWALRLLGWLPADIEYLEFAQVSSLVSSGSKRPKSTRDLIPDWFGLCYNAKELEAFGAGKNPWGRHPRGRRHPESY